MITVVGTNLKKEKLIEKAEKDGKQVPADKIRELETDSILEMQEKAKLSLRNVFGNSLLALHDIKNIRIRECTFQPEQRVVRFGTDIAGDAEKINFIDEK